jgi:hypothetical protein
MHVQRAAERAANSIEIDVGLGEGPWAALTPGVLDRSFVAANIRYDLQGDSYGVREARRLHIIACAIVPLSVEYFNIPVRRRIPLAPAPPIDLCAGKRTYWH